MKYFEFGKENKELMVILHGGGVSYRGALPAAEYMARFYHVVLVSYDGFNPTEPNTTFRSVDYEAEMLAKYLGEHYGGKIDILYGLSYGCRALGQFSSREAGFQSIISAGANNFCIHYDAYSGQARDGDMVLNDVGAQYDNLITDVSRGWPCNGKFTDRQKLLYECVLATSDYLFSIIRPGMKMANVDATIRRYNAQRLVDAGVMESVDQVGTYMWHGGAHHIGYDVHDAVETPEVIQPGMVFCVDVGVYHEEWGVGFRLEDNCLVTEDGCENLSAGIPRTVEEIEAVMRKRVQPHGFR